MNQMDWTKNSRASLKGWGTSGVGRNEKNLIVVVNAKVLFPR